jgi:alpha-beta hydrolase superfamily lysophospholipase
VRERGVLNWGWVQGILSEIDRKLPWASGASIALFTHDVYQYLHKPNLRSLMDDGVRSAFKPGAETVVVAHSLGTVVAYNVLKREGAERDLNVPVFMTLGSPLAVSVVKKALRPIAHPRCVGRWFNAMDERDIVALFPLTADHFDIEPPIENKVDIDNPTRNRHGITGYLGDPEVARRLYEAVS